VFPRPPGRPAVAAYRLTTAGPSPPQQYCPTWDVMMTRHRRGFSVIHPLGLPLACDTRSKRAPLGFPLSFAPSRYQPRTSGQGQVWNTDPSHVIGITPNLQSTNLLITCDIVSQHPLMPRGARSCLRSVRRCTSGHATHGCCLPGRVLATEDRKAVTHPADLTTTVALRTGFYSAASRWAGAQKGSRPMNPSILVCGPASSGTGTLAPY
jgi:hypothetical protein